MDEIITTLSPFENSGETQLGEWQLCPKCEGWGEVELPETSKPMFGTCPVCNGAKVLARPIINDKTV